MVVKTELGREKYKKIFIFAIAIIIILVIFLLLLNNAADSEELAMLEECDPSYSIITREEAEQIALQETESKYKIYFDEYGSVNSTYCIDGCWYISWYSEPIERDGGITISVDENTKHVVRVVGGDNIVLTEKYE